MKKMFWPLLLVIGFFVLTGSDFAQAGQPFTIELNPGPAVVDECKTSPPDSWTAYTNSTGATVRLEAVDIWAGLYRGAVYDLSIVVEIVKPGGAWMIVATFRWDHYAEPDGPHQRYIEFRSPFYLSPGDRVVVFATKCWIAGTTSPLHPIVLLYMR